ncbi:MAG: hypothetical protein BMS9Abin02_1678 [Anaerolineae bacterium]|nr:MAG: hypothetical protein BMS9Abin02_1678 [Anaerolineae bacterium]
MKPEENVTRAWYLVLSAVREDLPVNFIRVHTMSRNRPGLWMRLTCPMDLLIQHVTRDYAELTIEDIKENELLIKRGYRVFYRLEISRKIRVITEYDRSITKALRPQDY